MSNGRKPQITPNTFFFSFPSYFVSFLKSTFFVMIGYHILNCYSLRAPPCGKGASPDYRFIMKEINLQ